MKKILAVVFLLILALSYGVIAQTVPSGPPIPSNPSIPSNPPITGGGGDSGPIINRTPNGVANGQNCATTDDCAAGRCMVNPATPNDRKKICIGFLPNNSACTNSLDCESKVCADGVCGYRPYGERCAQDNDCQSNSCVFNVCMGIPFPDRGGTSTPNPEYQKAVYEKPGCKPVVGGCWLCTTRPEDTMGTCYKSFSTNVFKIGSGGDITRENCVRSCITQDSVCNTIGVDYESGLQQCQSGFSAVDNSCKFTFLGVELTYYPTSSSGCRTMCEWTLNSCKKKPVLANDGESCKQNGDCKSGRCYNSACASPIGAGHINECTVGYGADANGNCSTYAIRGALSDPKNIGIVNCTRHAMNYRLDGNVVTIYNYGETFTCTASTRNPKYQDLAKDPAIKACIAASGWCTVDDLAFAAPGDISGTLNNVSPTFCAMLSNSRTFFNCSACCEARGRGIRDYHAEVGRPFDMNSWVSRCKHYCSVSQTGFGR